MHINKYLPKVVIFSIIQIIFVSLTLTNLSSQEKYLWPTDASRLKTSAFGEYRPDRFHAGIDIKTWNRNGYKVFAVDDGFVSRIKTSPFGGGRALYITLKTGDIAVYYHLNGYSEKIDELVAKEQSKKNKYSIELWLKKGELPVKRGEVVAFTGRSGSKLPHLHFEIRNNKNQPVDPILRGFKADDKSPPVATKLSVRPMNISSEVEGDWLPVIYRLRWNKKGYYEINKPISVFGDIGLSLDAYDRNGYYENNFGFKKMQLKVSGKVVFTADYTQFGFNQNRQMNLDRDYRLLRREKGKFQKLYLDIGNTLSFYKNHKTGDGILRFLEDKEDTIPFEIIVSDNQNHSSKIIGRFKPQKFSNKVTFQTPSGDSSDSGDNKKIVKFRVNQDYQDEYLRISFVSSENLMELPEIQILKNETILEDFDIRTKSKKSFYTAVPLAMIEDSEVQIRLRGESDRYNYSSDFNVNVMKVPVTGRIISAQRLSGSIEIENGDAYKDFWLRLESIDGGKYSNEIDFAGQIIKVEPLEIPFHSNTVFKINYPNTEDRKDKLGLYALDNEGEWHFIPGDNNADINTITSSMSSLETVAVIRDTIPPFISKKYPDSGNEITNKRPEVTVWFDDELAGIGSEDDIELHIDGKKVIAEWEPQWKLIKYRFKENMQQGNHTVRIKIKDRVNNSVEEIWNFIIR